MSETKALLLESMVDATTVNDREYRENSRHEMQRLEDENRSLRREVEDLTEDKKRLTRTIENLRGQLSPLHTALRVVFGEIELGIGEEPAYSPTSPSSTSPASDPRWQSYKS